MNGTVDITMLKSRIFPVKKYGELVPGVLEASTLRQCEIVLVDFVLRLNIEAALPLCKGIGIILVKSFEITVPLRVEFG